MEIGIDPKSLGLIKYDTKNTDERYTAVSSNGRVNKYVLHPKYFTDRLGINDVNTDIYVGDIQIKGYVTHGIFETDLYQGCDVKLINNPFTGGNPKTYSDTLKDGTSEQYATHHLNYGSTIEPFSIDIRELPDIELNADTTISIKIGDLSFTRSLTHLLRDDRPDPILNVRPTNQRANGFEFEGNIAEVTFNSVYEKTFTQSTVIDGKTEYMIKNRNKERALMNSQIYQFATSTLGSLTDGFDILGGIGSALDAYLEYGLREAGFADMAKQFSEVGGNMIHDAVGQVIENLVTITYPIKKSVKVFSSPYLEDVDLFLGDYEVNNPKTFTINRRFYGVDEFLTYVQRKYKGTIVGGSITPLQDYGDYTKYFKRVIELGGLQ